MVKSHFDLRRLCQIYKETVAENVVSIINYSYITLLTTSLIIQNMFCFKVPFNVYGQHINHMSTLPCLSADMNHC